MIPAQGHTTNWTFVPKRTRQSVEERSEKVRWGYRFGFNGQEKDDEIHNASGTSVAFEARMFDSRVGRWLSLDPLAAKYPSLSPYVFTGNNPIVYREVDGRVYVTYISVTNQQTGKPELQKVTFDGVKATIQAVDKNRQAIGEVQTYAAGTSQLVDNMVASYDYVVKNNADVDGAMQAVASSPMEFEVKAGESDYKDGVIHADFENGLVVRGTEGTFGIGEGEVLGNESPALGFWSEAYHAYIDKLNPALKQQIKDDPQSLDAEEHIIHVEKAGAVIDALKKADPANKETKREYYESARDSYPATSPTSTDEKR